LPIVLRAMPVARATMATPPCPSAIASAAAHNRRALSLIAGASRAHFSATMSSGVTLLVDHALAIVSIPEQHLTSREPIDLLIREP
jgi:hypothetical protein